jgi:hypothetical protein
MKQISNSIIVEYEHFLLEVDYDWRKGHAGDYFNAPEPNETDIKKVIVTGYINDDGSIEELDTEVEFEMYELSKKHILEEIEYDVESLM